MPFKNTPIQYGSLSKLLHWSIAILVFIQLFIAFWVVYFLPEHSPQIGFLIGGIHKPVGILVLALGVLAILWRWLNPKPEFPFQMPHWEKLTANLVHYLLYLCLIIMPISGIIFSVAGGKPPSFFGLFQIPMFMAENKMISDQFFALHKFTGFFLSFLIILHILAALKHHFMDKDNVLRRML